MKYYKLSFFTVLFYLIGSSFLVSGQIDRKSTRLPFRDVVNNGRNYIFLNLLQESNHSSIKNIPDIADNFVLYKVEISKFHSMHQKYTNNEISADIFSSYIESIGMESINADIIEFAQSYFYIYVGVDLQKQKKYVMIDSNIDNNFKNDSLYSFNLSDYSEYDLQENPLEVNTKLHLTYQMGNVEESKSIILAIYPFYSDKKKERYDNVTDYYLDIGLFANNTKEAKLDIQDQSYKIIAYKNKQTDLLPWHLNEKSHFDIYDNNGEYLYDRLTLGDTIIIANKMIRLDSINKNNLIVNEVEDYSRVKSDIYIYPLYGNEQVTLKSVTEDKFVFVDFWGSWCNPCIHSIPLLNSLYEKIKHRDDVLILGIAAENEKDVTTLKNIISDKHILYPNFYVYTQQLKSVQYPHTAFQITQFPTYVLLDKNSNVIHKITNSKNTEKAISLFFELIDSN